MTRTNKDRERDIQKVESKIISPSAKTRNQKKYIKAMQDFDMVVCEGPAGTGKTHLAVGMGVFELRHNYVDKFVVARPAIEAGERIGYSPGTIDDKMDPFVRPVLDELGEFLYPGEIREYRRAKIIEIVPIAYMRGRTFKDAFILCDECQNLEFDQMKMLLTRFGVNSRMILTGDIAQSDLEVSKRGAFRFACELLRTFDEVATVALTNDDIQRHSLVGKMVESWEKNVEHFRKAGTIM